MSRITRKDDIKVKKAEKQISKRSAGFCDSFRNVGLMFIKFQSGTGFLSIMKTCVSQGA